MSGSAAEKEGERQGDFVGGKYLLEECLGIGGMGEVYRATNVSLGRKVAIKVLNKEHTKNEDDVLRFLREARAIAAVRHPNVVDVFDVARDDDGTPFIVQELLSGEDLEQYLASSRNGRVSVTEALDIIVPVAEAVSAAHARDVVHRDLKPANIFLAREGNKIVPKVLDFGAALYQTVGGLSARERRMLIGTPHYMAPEQITTKDVDVRADIWAIGVIIYEMLVGETPFEAPEANEVLKLVRTRAVPLLRKRAPEAPEALEILVARCLDRDRLKRHQAATDLARDLEAIRDSHLHPAPVSPPRTRQQAAAAMKADTPGEWMPAAPPPGARPRRVDDREEPGANSGPSTRIPSLILKGKTIAKRRGNSLLNLSAPDEDVAWDEPPPSPSPSSGARSAGVRSAGAQSASRPIGAAKALRLPSPEQPVRTAADVMRELDLSPPVSDDRDDGTPSSMPPVLFGASAARPARAPSYRPPPSFEPAPPSSSDPLSVRSPGPSSEPRISREPAREASREAPREAPREPAREPGQPRLSSEPRVAVEGAGAGAGAAPLAQTSAAPRGPYVSQARPAAPAPTWTAQRKAIFGAVVLGPALAGFLVFQKVDALVTPLGQAMRGESALGSGVLAVVALVSAAALATRALGSTRSTATLVAAGSALVTSIMMIIVTFSANETAELGVPPAAAAIVPFFAQLVPLALGWLAFARAREAWLDRYEERERAVFAALASVLLFAALELGPLGASRVAPSRLQAPVPHAR